MQGEIGRCGGVPCSREGCLIWEERGSDGGGNTGGTVRDFCPVLEREEARRPIRRRSNENTLAPERARSYHRPQRPPIPVQAGDRDLGRWPGPLEWPRALPERRLYPRRLRSSWDRFLAKELPCIPLTGLRIRLRRGGMDGDGDGDGVGGGDHPLTALSAEDAATLRPETRRREKASEPPGASKLWTKVKAKEKKTDRITRPPHQHHLPPPLRNARQQGPSAGFRDLPLSSLATRETCQATVR